MASEIRVNQIQNRSGLGTVTFNDTGVSIAGVTTVGILSATGNSVFSGNVTVSGTISGSSNGIQVGSSFIRATSIGIGTTNTTGRNAGISTAQGTLIFNSDTGSVQVYNGNAWRDVGKEAMNATGGYVNEYTDSTTGRIYRAHIFTSSGFYYIILSFSKF